MRERPSGGRRSYQVHLGASPWVSRVPNKLKVADVNITTWLIPPRTTTSAFHTRVHHVVTARTVLAADAGFAISSHSGPANHKRRIPSAAPSEGKASRFQNEGSAIATSEAGVSGVVALLPKPRVAPVQPVDAISSSAQVGKRDPTTSSATLPAFEGHMGWVQDADGYSNLVAPRTVIPMLISRVEGETWLASRVYARPFHNTLERGWMDGWRHCEASGWQSVEAMRKDLSV